VHSRKSITAILHKPSPIGQLGRLFQSQVANGGVEVGLEKWMATLLPAHPAEKSAADLGTVSIHRLRSAKVWVRWWGSGMLVGANTGPTNYSQSRYDPGMDIEKKKELWDRLENEPAMPILTPLLHHRERKNGATQG
jgi:hypothetical protein